MMDFKVGEVYNRRHDLHGRYGGQRQGGMSTPKSYPVILLFTGEGGAEHGYRDEFKPDGTYHYTGEGQRGDMAFVRSNRALRDHLDDGKRVHLFEAIGGGEVRYVGEVTCLGYHMEERLDTEGELRQAIVFELDLESDSPEPGSAVREPDDTYSPYGLRGKSPAELRCLALAGSSKSAPFIERRRNVRVRSEAVRLYVLKRAGGTCEGCGEPAPFVTKRKQPYLEPHHTTRLADGGPDHPAHVIALCPTCHRRVHHAHDGDDYNRMLTHKLIRMERS